MKETHQDTKVTVSNNGDLFNKHSVMLGRKISSFKDLYGQEMKFSDGKVIKSFPHMFGLSEEDIKIVEYDNLLGTDQQDILKMMGDRKILISVKHHAINPSLQESMKLQCTHIQIVIRVGDKVFTVNNPQEYEGGLFGDKTYPMYFLNLGFPDEMNGDLIETYEDNIIAWLAIANTFSKFPSDYDGGDPLTAKSDEEIKKLGDKLLSALSGDQDSIDWLSKEENKLYCAELAYVGLTLGITYPLNKSYLSESELKLIKDQFANKKFLSQNSNPFIELLDLKLSPENLKSFGLKEDNDFFGNQLAIRPMKVSDMLTAFIKYSVDRESLGNSCGKYQKELFEKAMPMINPYLPIEALRRGSKLNHLLEEVKDIFMTNYDSYHDFKSSLSKKLQEIDTEVVKYSNSRNVFLAPHCFFIRALENKLEEKRKGLLFFDYVGHGVHKDLI